MKLEEYIPYLAMNENSGIVEAVKSGQHKPDDKWVVPNKAPEKGGGYDIGFGHKITPQEKKSGKVYGVDITKPISYNDSMFILSNDAENKYNSTAKRLKGAFHKLSGIEKIIAVDYEFTGTPIDKKFPKFFKALTTGDKTTAYKEYPRYMKGQSGKMERLGGRNDFIKSLLDATFREGVR